MKRCPNCGTENRDFAEKCRKCRYLLPQPVNAEVVRCPNCGNENSAEANFCVYCQYQLKYVNSKQENSASDYDYIKSVDLNSMQNTDPDLAGAIAQVKSMALGQTLPEDVLQHIKTSAKNIDKIKNSDLPKIHWRNQGSDITLKEDNQRLMQAYETKYPSRKQPSLVSLVKIYNFPKYRMLHRTKLINRMTTLFTNTPIGDIVIPRFILKYSWLFNKYLAQIKGDQGEELSCRNLRKNGRVPFAHNVNIKFNYRRYYRRCCEKLWDKVNTYGHQSAQKKLNKYKCFYYISLNEPHDRDNNQIDILYINSYGIFIFEVKNYDYNKIWINKNGQIAWQNPKYKRSKYPDHQGSKSLPIYQQMEQRELLGTKVPSI